MNSVNPWTIPRMMAWRMVMNYQKRNFGLWSLDFGLWTLVFGLWSLDFGLGLGLGL